MKQHSTRFSIQGRALAISLAIIAVLIIAVVIIVLFFSPKDIKKTYFSRSLGDAATACEEEVDSHFSGRLISKHYDNISSRYEPAYKHYIVYYRVSHTETIDGIPSVEDSMAKCLVWESIGYVSKFNVFKP